jgi:hypothetical protein
MTMRVRFFTRLTFAILLFFALFVSVLSSSGVAAPDRHKDRCKRKCEERYDRRKWECKRLRGREKNRCEDEAKRERKDCKDGCR